jgi:hypothetical protein
MKNYEIVKIMKNLFVNRRHLGLSIIILLQNYFALDKSIRELAGNVCMIKMRKAQTLKIFNEIIETDKDRFEEIRDLVFDEPHNWLCVNIESQRIFKLFDEIKKTDDI